MKNALAVVGLALSGFAAGFGVKALFVPTRQTLDCRLLEEAIRGTIADAPEWLARGDTEHYDFLSARIDEMRDRYRRECE